MSKKAKSQGIDAALEALGKMFNFGVSRRGSELDVVDSTPTGYDELDSILVKDGRGIARGRVIEISGPESAGKSSVALRICGYAQKEGCTPYWLDLEQNLAKGGIAEINGVDMDNIIIPDILNTTLISDGDDDDSDDDEKAAKPKINSIYNAGQILDLVKKVAETGKFHPIVIDSLAAMVPEREANSESFNDTQMMEIPRLLSKALRSLVGVLSANNVSLILINQERDKPDMQTGRTLSVTPGGRAPKFFSSQRIRVAKAYKSQIYHVSEDGNKELVGHYARVTILKNRCAAPYDGEIEIPIYYKKYFPDEAERALNLAMSLKVITQRKGVITYKNDSGIVFKCDGASEALEIIRNKGLAGPLIWDCIAAQDSERNKSLKNPVVVPASLATLASKEPSVKASSSKEPVEDMDL